MILVLVLKFFIIIASIGLDSIDASGQSRHFALIKLAFIVKMLFFLVLTAFGKRLQNLKVQLHY